MLQPSGRSKTPILIFILSLWLGDRVTFLAISKGRDSGLAEARRTQERGGCGAVERFGKARQTEGNIQRARRTLAQCGAYSQGTCGF